MYHFVFFLTPSKNIEWYLGPFSSDDEVVLFEDDGFSLEDIAVYMGVFKSRTQARKNGWSGPIPKGYVEHKRGKRIFYTLWLTNPVISRKLCSELNSEL